MNLDIAISGILFIAGTVSLANIGKISGNKQLDVQFVLFCYLGLAYPFVQGIIITPSNNPESNLILRQIATCSATITIPIVLHFIILLTGRQAKRLLTITYLICFALCILALFNWHYYGSEIASISFSGAPGVFRLHKSGPGHQLRSTIWMITVVYCIVITILEFRKLKKYERPIILGLTLFAGTAVHDSLWAAGIYKNPYLPLANFGIIALVTTMVLAIIERYLCVFEEYTIRIKKIKADHRQQQKMLFRTLTGQTKKIALGFENNGNCISFVEKLDSVLADHIADPNFGPRQLALEMFVSMGHLNRRIKELKGMSTTYFLLQTRLERAAKLLITTEMTIIQISESSGFGNLSYFNRCFKKQYGITPKVYRKSSPQSYK